MTSTQKVTAPAVSSRATPKSKLNPSWYLTGVLAGISILVLMSGSLSWAIALVVGTTAFWVLMESLTVTLFLHRYMTHGAIGYMRPWLVRWYLWFSRSGMAKYWEWVQNHATHHELVDTARDSYTPQAYMIQTSTPALPPLRPWNFWLNARAYGRTSKFYREHPKRLEELACQYPSIRRALDRIAQIGWARQDYGNTGKATLINWGLFTITSLPLAVQLEWWGLLVIAAAPWVMYGVKVVAYLTGGYIINYYGHQAHDENRHQSDIPWWWQLPTLFVLGEGWHEQHHDAPFSARFHRWFDPGWWAIVVQAKLGLMADITVAQRTQVRRKYAPLMLYER